MTARDCDGTDDYLYRDSPNVTDTDATWMSWVKLDSIITTAKGFMSFGSSNVSDVFTLNIRLSNALGGVPASGDDVISIRAVDTGGVNYQMVGSSNIPVSTWAHIAVVASTSYPIYVNGNADTVNVISGVNNGNWIGNMTIPTGTTRFSLGSVFFQNALDIKIDGLMAYVGYWGRALTQAEVQQEMFNPGSVGGANWRGDWPLHGLSPETDRSGSGNDLTVSGATISQDTPPINKLWVPPPPPRTLIRL